MIRKGPKLLAMNQPAANALAKVSINRWVTAVVLSAVLIAASKIGFSQSNPDLDRFFQQDIGLTQDQVNSIRNGQPVSKALPPREPAEVFLFGAIYINAAPESYIKYAHDFERQRRLPGYLALGVFSSPPQASDFKGFSFDPDDMKTLKNCKSGDCAIQLPASSIEDFQQSIDWSAPNVTDQVNQHLQKAAMQRLLAYQRDGNQALGVYNDKRDPTLVPEQFAYMLSYSKALPAQLPRLYRYLLDYPGSKPSNVDETFYWTRVKFGLKPTLRVVQMVTMHGSATDPIACAVAQKQLYSSHYFETALDLSFCVRTNDTKQTGFYLIMAMGSEQAGLTGIQGSIVRKTAVGRSVSNLQNALKTIKSNLESHNP